MTAFERATRDALAAIKRHAGVPVSYRRGPVTIQVTAIRGETTSRDHASQGIRLGAATADYLIDAADLDFGDGPAEPVIGDEIDDAGRTYEVTTLGDGDRPWRWHDRLGLRRRIHTVER